MNYNNNTWNKEGSQQYATRFMRLALPFYMQHADLEPIIREITFLQTSQICRPKTGNNYAKTIYHFCVKQLEEHNKENDVVNTLINRFLFQTDTTDPLFKHACAFVKHEYNEDLAILQEEAKRQKQLEDPTTQALLEFSKNLTLPKKKKPGLSKEEIIIKIAEVITPDLTCDESSLPEFLDLLNQPLSTEAAHLLCALMGESLKKKHLPLPSKLQLLKALLERNSNYGKETTASIFIETINKTNTTDTHSISFILSHLHNLNKADAELIIESALDQKGIETSDVLFNFINNPKSPKNAVDVILECIEKNLMELNNTGEAHTLSNKETVSEKIKSINTILLRLTDCLTQKTSKHSSTIIKLNINGTKATLNSLCQNILSSKSNIAEEAKKELQKISLNTLSSTNPGVLLAWLEASITKKIPELDHLKKNFIEIIEKLLTTNDSLSPKNQLFAFNLFNLYSTNFNQENNKTLKKKINNIIKWIFDSPKINSLAKFINLPLYQELNPNVQVNNLDTILENILVTPYKENEDFIYEKDQLISISDTLIITDKWAHVWNQFKLTNFWNDEIKKQYLDAIILHVNSLNFALLITGNIKPSHINNLLKTVQCFLLDTKENAPSPHAIRAARYFITDTCKRITFCGKLGEAVSTQAHQVLLSASLEEAKQSMIWLIKNSSSINATDILRFILACNKTSNIRKDFQQMLSNAKDSKDSTNYITCLAMIHQTVNQLKSSEMIIDVLSAIALNLPTSNAFGSKFFQSIAQEGYFMDIIKVVDNHGDQTQKNQVITFLDSIAFDKNNSVEASLNIQKAREHLSPKLRQQAFACASI